MTTTANLFSRRRLPIGRVDVPVVEIRARSDGPTLLLVAGQHGNEMGPIWVARNLIEWALSAPIAGRLLILPVANPVAVAAQSRSTPLDGIDGNGGNLNRLWPGRPEGSLTERIADAIWALVSESDAVVDLHGTTTTMHLAYGYQLSTSDALAERANEIGRAFGMEILVEHPPLAGSLTEEATRAGVPAIAVELGEFSGLRLPNGFASGTSGDALSMGMTGVKNVFAKLGMLEGPVERPMHQVLVRPEQGVGIATGGLLRSHISRRDIGRVVPGGTPFGEVLGLEDLELIETLRAPFEQSLVLAVTETSPLGLARPGLADFGYYVADFATAQWIEGGPSV